MGDLTGLAASISTSSNRFSASAKSLGKKWRGWEARLSGPALAFGTAEGPGAGAVGGAENRSGVVSARGRIGMALIIITDGSSRQRAGGATITLVADKDRVDEAKFCDRSCNLRHLLLGMGAGIARMRDQSIERPALDGHRK